MERSKLRQRSHFLVDLRVILHRAGTQRIETVVHAEVISREIGVMPDNGHLVALRQLCVFLTTHGFRHLVLTKVVLGKRIALATLLREFENQVSV